MREYRVKEWQSFLVQDDHFYLDAVFVNIKYYRMVQVFLYDKETRERMFFRKILPFNGWRLPQGLYHASIDSRSYGFFFRIHDWLDAETIKVDIDIAATRKRPSFTAHLEYDLNKKKVVPMAVNLLFSEQRSMYAYKTMAPVRGDMVFGGRHISLDPRKATGFFGDYKGYYPYRMLSTRCTGNGFDAENRRYGFSMAENQAKETHKNNENALWVDGQLTPLPPVRITMPGGTESDWVIQDMDGMVDLTFTPQEHDHSAINLIATCAVYDTPIGSFNGTLINAAGEQIPVHNLWGSGEKLYLRV
jgi:hypothetical protein